MAARPRLLLTRLAWLAAVIAIGCSSQRVATRGVSSTDLPAMATRVAFALDRADGLDDPLDIAIDPRGRLLVLDAGGPDLVAFEPDGRFIARWPVSGSTDERIFRPTDLTISGLAVLLMDPDERVVHRYDLRGQFQGVALDLTHDELNRFGFVQPRDVVADRAGQLYVADREGNRVLVFSANGRFLLSIGAFGAGEGQLRAPVALAVDAAGRLGVAEAGNRRVQWIDTFGTPLAALPLPSDPVALAHWPRRGTLVADSDGRVLLAGPAGRVRVAHVLSGVRAIAVHSSGRVFVLSRARARVEALDAEDP